MATRSGVDEFYQNTKLKEFTSYCFYLLIHHVSEVGNEVVVRYAELSCQKTDRGYNLVALIIGLILAVLLLLLCFVVFCLICCRCYRSRSKKYDLDGTSEVDSHDPQNFQLLIRNPGFRVSGKKIAIPIAKYPSYVELMHENDDIMFSREFAVIEPNHNPTKIAFDSNSTKNRYKAIPAYDHSRVVLKDTSLETDYINANHIQGYEKSSSFIATQTPMGNTVDEFWTMLWEQNVNVIVMLTSLEEEEGNSKYHRYWPEFFSGITEYGFLEVELKEENNDEQEYIVRTFTVSDHKSTRAVIQFHYNLWSIDGLPDDRKRFLNFVQAVRDTYYKMRANDEPMIVHCSNGVGRTGVFMAITAQLDCIMDTKTVDIYGCVQYMRQQRSSVVLNKAQYIYIHDVILDSVVNDELMGDTRISDSGGLEESGGLGIENPHFSA